MPFEDEKPDLDLGDEDFYDSQEFDISDIRFHKSSNIDRTRFDLILRADSPLNVMRIYLAMKAYIFKIEQELNIGEEHFEEH